MIHFDYFRSVNTVVNRVALQQLHNGIGFFVRFTLAYSTDVVDFQESTRK